MFFKVQLISQIAWLKHAEQKSFRSRTKSEIDAIRQNRVHRFFLYGKNILSYCRSTSALRSSLLASVSFLKRMYMVSLLMKGVKNKRSSMWRVFLYGQYLDFVMRLILLRFYLDLLPRFCHHFSFFFLVFFVF